MTAPPPLDAPRQIMLDFAETTGLRDGSKGPRRYLWTDAFAVCNFLELYRRSADQSWRDLALRLVDQVHHVLGRHRPDSGRGGWLSGLSDAEGERHPTSGGLRIGKRLNERRSDEPSDERLEWDRDGQYYHYLTKWMHALNRVSRVTGDPVYLGWAVELAQVAHARFSYQPSWGGAKRLYWKMSIDLSRPQVTSMGQHDPLDGLVTCCELQAATGSHGQAGFPDLAAEIAELSAICRGSELATDDALGIGGLLCDASSIAELTANGHWQDAGLLQEVVRGALLGLESYAVNSMPELSGRYRLAFRELGLAIGLKAAARWPESVAEELRPRVQALARYLPLAEQIDAFWLDGKNQETATWKEHRDINMVMLATSLAPSEFLAAT
jgi:hypothetical protein